MGIISRFNSVEFADLIGRRSCEQGWSELLYRPLSWELGSESSAPNFASDSFVPSRPPNYPLPVILLFLKQIFMQCLLYTLRIGQQTK